MNESVRFDCNNSWPGWSEEVASTILKTGCNAQYKMLPTYSPELNPVELIFAYLKNELRKYPIDAHLESSVKEVMSTVDRGDIIGYYQHCGYLE